MSPIKELADESVINILEYLRAMDLVSVSEVDKTIFHKTRVSRAVKYQLEHIYVIMSSPLKEKRIPDSPMNSPGSRSPSEYGCDVLYVREIKSILLALGLPAPVAGRGYWISSSWVANAKKYFEAINLPENKRKAGGKKMIKRKQRRGSDSLPPWPSMNADITCPHDSLALTKGFCAKKRLIDSKSWFFLRKFYPMGPQFKSTCSCCEVCTTDEEEAKTCATVKKEAEQRLRRPLSLSSGLLDGLLSSKHGVPSHLVTPSGSSWGHPDSGQVYQPLVPGSYYLVPRCWLKSWRACHRERTYLPPLDCTSLLCYAHGLLIIPSHVEEYLVGLRRSLLGGLGRYTGEVVEILSASEWGALQDSLNSLCDFNVRLTLDGENVQWNMKVCSACAPAIDSELRTSCGCADSKKEWA